MAGLRQLPVGQRFSSMCAIKSASKCCSAERIGPKPNCPCPHSELDSIVLPMFRIRSRSDGRLSKRATRSTTSSSCSIPRRQGKHLPQDSYCVNATRLRVMSTAQVSSSITITPPDPNIAPASRISSKSM